MRPVSGTAPYPSRLRLAQSLSPRLRPYRRSRAATIGGEALGCSVGPDSHAKQGAIEAARYLKFKNPMIDLTVRDLEGIEETIVIPSQPQVRR